MIRKYLLPLAALAMGVFAVVYVVAAQKAPPALTPPVEPPHAMFNNTVAGSGIVEAQTENIALGSPLPGVVSKVFVPVDKVGLQVKKDTPLFQVDDAPLLAQLRANEANLASAQAQLDKLKNQPRPEEVPATQAKLDAAQANLEMQKDQADRANKLLPTHAISEEEYRQKEQMYQVALRQREQAKAEFNLLKAGAWSYDIKIAEAAVAQAQAAVEQTRTDLKRTKVLAPVDGDVLQVNVRPGEFVGTPPSQALVVLGNIHQLHVRVDIDENDIPRFRRGAPARATLRGNPQIQFPLTYLRVEPYVIPKKNLTGDNTERVDTRVLQVIYQVEVDPNSQNLYVGQQVDVSIDVGEAKAGSGK